MTSMPIAWSIADAFSLIIELRRRNYDLNAEFTDGHELPSVENVPMTAPVAGEVRRRASTTLEIHAWPSTISIASYRSSNQYDDDR